MNEQHQIQAKPKSKDQSLQLDGQPIFRKLSAGFACGLTRLLYRIEYVNRENMPQSGPAILVANHTSLLDITAIKFPIKPWIYYVAKKQLFEKSITNFFFRSMGCIPVDRDKVDLQAARNIFSVLSANRIVAMFPQATRVPDDRVLSHPPRTGVAHFAIKTGSPIIPVLVDGHFSFFKKTRIIFGEPFQLPADPRKRYSHAEMMAFTIDVMQKIYDLKGFAYRLTDASLLAEGLVRRADGTLAEATQSEQAAASLLKSLGQAEGQ